MKGPGFGRGPFPCPGTCPMAIALAAGERPGEARVERRWRTLHLRPERVSETAVPPEDCFTPSSRVG
ncbi:hypothetical protein GCM10009748_21460 [Agromyces lapidis]